MDCLLIEVVQAWDFQFNKYTNVKFLQCSYRNELIHKTEPENVGFTIIDGKIHWHINLRDDI